jgi:hypothetical protein
LAAVGPGCALSALLPRFAVGQYASRDVDCAVTRFTANSDDLSAALLPEVLAARIAASPHRRISRTRIIELLR